MTHPLLEMQSITKDFPGVRAVDDVSFDVQHGEIHALCGENGAGKSTLIKVLGGVYPRALTRVRYASTVAFMILALSATLNARA